MSPARNHQSQSLERSGRICEKFLEFCRRRNSSEHWHRTTFHHSPYKIGMLEVVHKVLADLILLGMILFAMFFNAGALGMKWERRREADLAPVSCSS